MTVRPPGFLAADRPLSQARVAILGVPLERTVSFRGGPAAGPAAIRAASWSVEEYSVLSNRHLSQVGVCDLGDVDCDRPLGQILADVQAQVGRLLKDGRKAVLLGGEHTLTLGAVRGVKGALGGVQLLAMDAHSDLRDTYRGERVSHATVLRRASEVAHRLAIVGARSLFGGEVGEPFFAGPEEVPELLSPDAPVWLSLDLDALDPALCPGVTNPEPGGLSYREVIELLRRLRPLPVVGMDIVELAPPFDPSGVSAICAAKLVVEAICGLWAAAGS
ncbi:MAG: arginase family protein [Candidatus Bipolaricaulaceae bacterium]